MIVLWMVEQVESKPTQEDKEEALNEIQQVSSFEEVERLVLNHQFVAVVIVTSQLEPPEVQRLSALVTILPVYFFTDVDEQTQFVIKFILFFLATLTDDASNSIPLNLSSMKTEEVDWLKSIQYIRDNLDNNELSLEDVAKRNYVSKWHFSKVFKKKIGITFRDFLIDERIELAKKLLMTHESVTSVCYEVGYGDLTHFGRIFQKRVGMPPSLFRKNHMNSSAAERRKG